MKVFLGITCYDHKIFGECSESILKNCVTLMKNGHEVIPYYSNDLYIDRSRNMIVNLFLDSDCTDLVFIDSDLIFDDDAILKLLKYDRDIIGGAYPYKKIQEEYPITLKFDEQNNCKEEETGLVYAERIPTGLMRIQRRVFDKLKVKYDERGIGQYFRTGIVFENENDWYGEDTYFCRICNESGINIFIEPRINFTHIGNREYKGNLHNYLMGRRVDIFADTIDKVESGIKGWTTDKELKVLKLLASKSNNVIEIGCWKGRSTKVLLESCKGTVYAIDTWKGNPHYLTGLNADLNDVYNDFLNNVGSYKNLIVLKEDSLKVKFDDFVDMIFIDADHEYEAVKADIEKWMPKCKKFICGHDYDYPGVKKAVDEKFENVNIIDSIWWKEL